MSEQIPHILLESKEFQEWMDKKLKEGYPPTVKFSRIPSVLEDMEETMKIEVRKKKTVTSVVPPLTYGAMLSNRVYYDPYGVRYVARLQITYGMDNQKVFILNLETGDTAWARPLQEVAHWDIQQWILIPDEDVKLVVTR